MWDVSADWHVVGTGDFNGDGLTDILWRNDDGSITDWLADPTSGFYGNADNFLTNPGTSWHVEGTGDFNGDGKVDILWRDDSGLGTDWMAEANGAFYGNADNFLAQVDNGWQIVGTGDFNGDGLTGILWQSSDGLVTDWLAQADGSFYGNASNFLSQVGTGWHIVGTADFNGDARSDVLLRNDDGTVTDWLAAPDGSLYGNSGNVLAPLYVTSQIAGVGDFNGDGRDDILVRVADGALTDWLGQANGGFIANDAIAMQPVSLDLQVAGIGDFNGDGRSDVLFRSTDGTLDEWVGSATGAILSPTELAWQEAIADIAQFVDSAADLFASSPTGSDGGPEAPLTGYAAIFGPSYPNVSEGAFDTYPSGATSHTFSLNSINDTGFSGSVSDSDILGSVTVIDDAGDYLFDIDGVQIVGAYHFGVPSLTTPSESIVITGVAYPDHSHDGYFQFIPTSNGLDFHNGYGGGAPHVGQFQMPGASAAAKLFASQHVHNLGVGPEDEHYYELALDALADFYDWASANPLEQLDVGNGLNVSAAEALLDFSRVNIFISDSGGGTHGAATTFSYGSLPAAAIVLNPMNAYQLDYVLGFGDAGIYFNIFHELGHVLNTFEYGLYNGGDEAAANTAGRSMENALHVSLMSADPTFGYD